MFIVYPLLHVEITIASANTSNEVSRRRYARPWVNQEIARSRPLLEPRNSEACTTEGLRCRILSLTLRVAKQEHI